MAFLAESGDERYFFMAYFAGSNRRMKEFIYVTPDNAATVTGAGYFDFEGAKAVHPGNSIRVIQATNRNDLTTIQDEYRLFVTGRSGTVLTVELRAVSAQELGASAIITEFLGAADLAAAKETLEIPSAADLSGYAPLASPTFTGNPLAPTPSPGDNDTSIATTGFVKAAIDVAVAAILNGVSGAFDTLSEIATDLGLKMVKTANLGDVADAPTAFANIKQAASTTATGVAELATDAEAIAKADTARVLTPSNLAAMGASDTFAGLIEIATDAEQETGTDTGRAVVTGRQHRHPSAAKFWAHVTVSGGTPTLSTSYNVTSITDVGAGDLLITIATDFSSANWSSVATVEDGTNPRFAVIKSKAAGTVGFLCRYDTGTALDPTSYSAAGYGDQ